MFYYIALLFCLPVVGHLDAPEAWQMGFQDPATPVMQGIIDLHHDICFFMEPLSRSPGRWHQASFSF
jgi:hypothetical protein